MKCTVVGFKRFQGKDGRRWVNCGLVYSDMTAQGNMFAESLMMSDDNNISNTIVPGAEYVVEFDSRGRMVQFVPADK